MANSVKRIISDREGYKWTDRPTELQAIFDRVEAGKRLRKQDLTILMTATRSQQITIATGDRAVAIGGSADGAVIVTGDR